MKKKNLIILAFTFLIMWTGEIEAGGFKCDALCISLIPNDQALYFLGTIKQRADMKRGDVLDATNDLCMQRASQNGHDSLTALLVTRIPFSSSQRTKWVSDQSGSSQSYVGAGQVIAGGFYHYYIGQYAYAQTDYAYHSYLEYEHEQHLAADPIRADSRVCKRDSSIPAGTQPYYSGDQELYP